MAGRALDQVKLGLSWGIGGHPWGSRQSGSAKGHPDRFTHVRDENGVWRRAITLADEISGAIGKAVLDELVERGLVRCPAL
jgi:hypothetical protein